MMKIHKQPMQNLKRHHFRTASPRCTWPRKRTMQMSFHSSFNVVLMHLSLLKWVFKQGGVVDNSDDEDGDDENGDDENGNDDDVFVLVE